MQLQMTAPLDIGLSFQDQALGHGQEDILDLEMSKKQLGKQKNHVDLINLVDDKDDFESDEGEQGEDPMDEDEGILDPEDKKVDDLEAELDGLYDAYQKKMGERDAKYMVKEARRKDKSREEWHGIQQQDSDDEDESEGGYDVVQTTKARFGEDSDSDSDFESDDDQDTPFAGKLKRIRGADANVGGRQSKKARTGQQLETSRATSMWFNQDVFAGVDLTVSGDEDEDEDEDRDEEMYDDDDGDLGEEGGEDVSQSEGSAGSQDEFEVVPQEDLDEEMWEVDDEDQDEIKRLEVQSTVLETLQAMTNPDESYRIRSVNRRGCLYSPPAGQPGNHQNPPDQRWVQPLLPQFQGRVTGVVPRRRE
jgi:AdoMet-dependent rRNA methyltransferase SPB1